MLNKSNRKVYKMFLKSPKDYQLRMLIELTKQIENLNELYSKMVKYDNRY